ncbi:hypothetical protein [Leptospira santarosai]|uniref:hypothetical protein n=1 Tax=Leptospira santarosai TaxID=28183 RepID=UPI000774159A|nr:hypothetical protein [Leptospira santarosai]
MKVIQTNSRFQAWFEAMKYLSSEQIAFNLILSIDKPMIESPFEKEACLYLDNYYKEKGEYPIHTVAETIFPGWEYKKHGINGVYRKYPDEVYPRLKSSKSISWGTYAYRIVRRNTHDGDTINPLKCLIEKMKSVHSNPKSGKFRSCYELNISEGEYDIPLYNTAKDSGRRMGAPCLSHLSFKLFEKKVHLTAIYRSHDYRVKVPGNLLGLARLQSCIAREVGISPGTMVIHSTYAYIGNESKRELNSMRNQIDSILRKGDISQNVAI